MATCRATRSLIFLLAVDSRRRRRKETVGLRIPNPFEVTHTGHLIGAAAHQSSTHGLLTNTTSFFLAHGQAVFEAASRRSTRNIAPCRRRASAGQRPGEVVRCWCPLVKLTAAGYCGQKVARSQLVSYMDVIYGSLSFQSTVSPTLAYRIRHLRFALIGGNCTMLSIASPSISTKEKRGRSEPGPRR
ncbi:hypothetical protein GQ53DRAFT_456918 [Thozetella sp. PMI_491]|nr:hypothetical protein GQ53DRAFT_456918 [Thozetella sp. PMI_491]